MITLEQFYQGRDRAYRDELTLDIIQDATLTVERVNELLAHAAAAGVTLHRRPDNGSLVNSGWRPAAVNSKTPGAAPMSKHMKGQACDVYDPEGELDEWCLANADVLEEIGLWQEHPSATKGWCHVQTVPPRSGNRVFYP